MRVGLMTREYPPQVYGGAGVHVEYLSRELAKLIEVEVHCWGTQRRMRAICMCAGMSRRQR
jgi:starch synthase